ncbi:MAG: DUF11 domain-containing protein [Lachnospiraceae bacterium]|nr:DUF11 domain-containing protein [Lachnospiraceae bacterium]
MVRAKYTIQEPDIYEGFTNTVEARFSDEDPVYKATDVVDADIEKMNAHITVTKADANAAQNKKYGLGDTVTFTITAKNDGNVALSEVVIEDPLTGQVFRLLKLGVNETYEETVTYTVTEADIRNGKVTNIATVTEGTVQDGRGTKLKTTDPENPGIPTEDVTPGIATVDTAAPNAHITLRKTTPEADAGSVYAVGETIAYTITATNDGNINLTNVVIEDELTGNTVENGRAWTFDKLDVGETVTMETAYTVTQEDVINGRVRNVATATADTGVGLPADPDDPDAPVQPELKPAVDGGMKEDPVEVMKPGVVVIKEADKVSGVSAGDVITYTIRVTNNGNVELSDVEVTDELTGDRWTIDSLAAGASQVYTAAYTVTEADLLRGSIVNTATAKGTDPNGNEVTPETPGEAVTDTEPVVADYTVHKTVTDSQTEYKVGDTIHYTITVTSQANVALRNVVITDQLSGASGTVVFAEQDGAVLNPDHTVTIEELAAGATVTLNCEYTTTREDAGSSIVNTAVAAADPVTGPSPVDPGEESGSTDPVTVESIYSLLIHYVYEDGTTAAEDVAARYLAGETFVYLSPEIEGYIPDYAFVRTEAAGMPAQNVEVTVVYTRIPAQVTPGDETETTEPDRGTGEEPGEAPGESTVPGTNPAPVPDTEPAAGPQAEAAEVPGADDEGTGTAVTPAPVPAPVPVPAPGVMTPEVENVEPGNVPLGAAVQEDEEGNIIIIPVEDPVVPLAGITIDDHRCCILHFLLTLAAVIVYICYTKSMKKHQERIAGLRDKYEIEILRRKSGVTDHERSTM